MGVGNYTEADVYAAARVFTGWNLARPGAAGDGSQHYEFVYNAGQHDTAEKTFSFPIYPDGSKTIPARAAADGMQDGLDLHRRAGGASRTRRATWRRKLYRFFVSRDRASRRRVRRPHRRGLSAEPLRHEGGDARGAAVAAVLGSRARTSRAIRGRSSSSSARSRTSAGRGFSVERRADAAVEHGAEPVRPARRRRLGRRAGRGSRPARCWRA